VERNVPDGAEDLTIERCIGEGEKASRPLAAAEQSAAQRKATAATLSSDRPGLLLSLSCLCKGI